MSTDTDPAAKTAPDRFVSKVKEFGPQLAEHAVRHDREGTFVTESFELLKDAGWLGLAVPEELGGMGATIRQTTWAQAEMAKYCPSTALAISMHLHITLFAAWRYRREMPGAEAMLRRVVDDRIVLVSTGGSDFTRPNGTAEKVDGGYKVSGRKIFCSQVPMGDVLSTLFTYEDPEQGRRVLGAGVAVAQDGVEVLDTWDTFGMRGTGSHDVTISDVFIADAQIQSNRPWGVIDPPLMAIASHAMPVISGVYLGVAEGARDKTVAQISGTAKVDDPTVQRLVGLMDYKLAVARWALTGALDLIGDDPVPALETVAAAMHAKRAVAEEAVSACDVAMDVLGGAGYYRKYGIEQAVRDVRGVRFHPLTPELTLLLAGKVILGVPADAW